MILLRCDCCGNRLGYSNEVLNLGDMYRVYCVSCGLCLQEVEDEEEFDPIADRNANERYGSVSED